MDKHWSKTGMRLKRLRWAIVTLSSLILSVFGCGGEQNPDDVRGVLSNTEPVYSGTIVALGDSLTAGLGLEESQAYPAQLTKKLRSEGYNYRVINAGISGETSSGTLSRINWVISTLKPDIIILETGANDGMRGIDPDILTNNLDQIISKIQSENISVLLAGMKMFPNLGPVYGSAFERVYPQVAQKHDIILVPFFLDGVAGDAHLNLEDGIHPNGEGYIRIVENLYPYLLKLLKKGD